MDRDSIYFYNKARARFISQIFSLLFMAIGFYLYDEYLYALTYNQFGLEEDIGISILTILFVSLIIMSFAQYIITNKSYKDAVVLLDDEERKQRRNGILSNIVLVAIMIGLSYKSDMIKIIGLMSLIIYNLMYAFIREVTKELSDGYDDTTNYLNK
ncbi:MAG: hypothetical protein GXZ08_08730 [Tissierellia bacterium]|nr:hypothetical protein [Tissierellia bacterium]